MSSSTQSFFKLKSAAKPLNTEAKTTLDALHGEKINALKKEKDKVSDYRKQVEQLKARLEKSTSDVEIWNLEQQIEKLERKIADIESDSDIFNYYLRTGDILFQYYDVQEKIHSGKMKPTVSKARPGSILAILNDLDTSKPSSASVPSSAPSSSASSTAPTVAQAPTQPTTQTTTEKVLQREDLLNKYLELEDPEKARNMLTTTEEDAWTLCECGAEMVICMNEATLTCSKCGHEEFILIDSDKPSYKDPPREISYYAYKKINHFNEWLAQFQAKESTEIPQEIYDRILLQLKKERITNYTNLKRTKMREILRNLGETKYYEHIPHIINRLSGQNAPFMSREDEEKLRHMFREIQPSFKKHIPKGRRNFLSYGYILYKFCELLGMDEYLACFPLLKNRDKLYVQDSTWRKICSDMKWQFIRTV